MTDFEEAIYKVIKLANQAYRVDAVAEWFDEDGDSLKAALEELRKLFHKNDLIMPGDL